MATFALLPSLVIVAVLVIGLVEERAAAAGRRRLGRARTGRPVALVTTPADQAPAARVA